MAPWPSPRWPDCGTWPPGSRAGADPGPAASLAGLVALTAYVVHALGGLSLPLAILAVRGWRRLRLPAVAGAAAVALITVPGTVYWARELERGCRPPQQLYLSADEDDAR